MKKVTVAVAMMASALAISAAYAADLNQYSSRAALIGTRGTTASVNPIVMIAGEHSTKWALLTARPSLTAEPQVVVAANYNSKAGLRGERTAEIELAPLK